MNAIGHVLVHVQQIHVLHFPIRLVKEHSSQDDQGEEKQRASYEYREEAAERGVVARATLIKVELNRMPKHVNRLDVLLQRIRCFSHASFCEENRSQ